MSYSQIMEWIAEHEGMKSRSDYFDTARKTQHLVRYDNGDTYQHIEIYESMTKKRTETIINNRTVRTEELVFHCFGWKSTKTTIL